MAGTEHAPHHLAHAAAWEALPGYVSGSLDATAHAAVREHLGSCLVCTRELRRLALIAEAVRVPTGSYACSQAYTRFSRRIRGARATRWARWRACIRALLRPALEPLPLVAGAALLVGSTALVSSIVLLGGEASVRSAQPFQTLGQQSAGQRGLEWPLLRVVLRGNPSAAERAAWLARHEAELVDGPTEIGVMTVRVTASPRDYQTLIDDLRADAETVFVEPLNLVGLRPDRRR